MNTVRTDLRSIFVTVVVVALIGGPAAARVVADFSEDSDKVDGKHAVGSSASRSKAAKKLVALNADGKLPAKFLPTVPNAEQASHADTASFADDSAHAAEADALGGLPPSNFIQGNGRVIRDSATIQGSGSLTTSLDVLDVDDFGRFVFACGNNASLTYFSDHLPDGRVWIDTGAADPSFALTAAGPGGIGSQHGPVALSSPADRQVWEFAAPPAIVSVVSHFEAGSPNTCHVWLTLLIQ